MAAPPALAQLSMPTELFLNDIYEDGVAFSVCFQFKNGYQFVIEESSWKFAFTGKTVPLIILLNAVLIDLLYFIFQSSIMVILGVCI